MKHVRTKHQGDTYSMLTDSQVGAALITHDDVTEVSDAEAKRLKALVDSGDGVIPEFQFGTLDETGAFKATKG